MKDHPSAVVGGCRFCGARLSLTMVDLGMSPLCETYITQENLNRMEPFYPLHVYILEYEIPKYDADLGMPNLFVRLDESLCRRKAQYILEAFPSQKERRWFTEDTFLSLLRLRGVECASPERYAEAFHCRKLVLAG